MARSDVMVDRAMRVRRPSVAQEPVVPRLLFGTDHLGRSMLSRAVHGAQVSLLVGTVAAVVGATIGAFLGMLSGYFGKWTDSLTRLAADAMPAFPPLIPSWGGMISDGKDAIADSPHMVFVPSLVIFFTVFALNKAGDHLRHRFDRTLHD